MKRFLFVFVPVLLFVFALVLGQGNLIDLNNKSFDFTAYSLNLGFVVQDFNKNGDVIQYKRNGDVIGECVTLNLPKINLNKICERLGLTVTNKYFIEDKLLIEGTSARLKYEIPGRQANVQISASDNQIIIGSPIIYGSY